MKKLASLVLAGAMAFSLAPAGGSSANAGTSTPAASTPASGGIEPIELTIYSPGNENSVPTKTIIEYARLVNEASDGAITLDVHHSNELGSDAESIESTRMGTIDLIFAGTSGFTSFYEKAKVLDLPFLFDSAEQAYEVTNSEIGEQIFSGLEEFGLVFLSEGDNGMRHISTTNRPVHTAADVQGLKIRVPESQLYLDVWQALGATPWPWLCLSWPWPCPMAPPRPRIMPPITWSPTPLMTTSNTSPTSTTCGWAAPWPPTPTPGTAWTPPYRRS